MPRIMIKGGVWRNTEDEILKASIMKYGPNQWSRVASLFHKKSAKQCKARWCEWLDPSIKKTEWSREEEEKLLNLAKLFPCQWRTIAPMVGRTPAQCLEHYEHLLDKAQRKEGETAKDDDLKRNKASELDTCPENKPALPDPQDMDEDEIEMLSEARARLANTQGKKAKRKAREKQLEEARRLSSLQKRQELREAGIEIGRFKRKKKRRAVDYNAEIPFEQKPPPGFYDISNELPPPTGDIPRGSTIQSLEGPTRDELEEKERKKDKEKQLNRKETDLPGLVAQINQLSHSEINNRKRSKLVLPEPQISDGELEEMIKVGHIGQNALDMATDSANDSSNLLLSSYSMSSGPNTPMRTPQVPIEESYVQKEAENLIALTQQQTPLKGGENTILQNTGVTGLLSKSKVIQTPNTVLGTPFRTPGPIQSGTGNGTPGGVSSCTTPSVSGGTTPGSVRDKLHINPEDAISELTDYTAAGQDTYQRLQVKQTLATLPAPRNDFQVVMPEMDTKSTITSLDGGPRLPEGFIEDQADIDQRMEEERLQDLEEMISKQTQVIQRNLPRPLDVNKTILRGKIHSEQRYKELYEAEELIKLEMLKLISYDLVNFPPDNLNKQQKEALSALSDELQINPLEEISPEEIQQSSELLKEEEFVVREAMNHGNLNLDTYSKIWDECYKQVLYLPNQKKYTRASLTGNKEKLDYLENKFANNRACMTKEAKNAVKLEKKVKILLGGYQMRAATLSKRIEDTSDQLEHLYTEYVTFDSLKRQEEMAIPFRLDTLKRLVEAQHDRHSQLQDKYSDLLLERDELKAALSVNYK